MSWKYEPNTERSLLPRSPVLKPEGCEDMPWEITDSHFGEFACYKIWLHTGRMTGFVFSFHFFNHEKKITANTSSIQFYYPHQMAVRRNWNLIVLEDIHSLISKVLREFIIEILPSLIKHTYLQHKRNHSLQHRPLGFHSATKISDTP